MRIPFNFHILLTFLLFIAGCMAGNGAAPSANAPYAVGQASWYGGKFHGRTTASGERFNKNAITAAHAKLPFGTMVEVRNKENGRAVVVRINDRFPGTRGRVIDLSEAAFSRIAPTAKGVINVELRVIGR